MRYIFFYIFLFSQFLNFLSVFAEKIRKDLPVSNPIKWQKVKENKSNDFNNIIWKSYKNDNSYFKNESLKIKSEKDIIGNKNENKTILSKQKNFNVTQIESFIPLNNFIDTGNFQTKVEWKTSFDGGAGDGIGQQNNSFEVNYGISDEMLFSAYFAEADDDTYNYVNGQRGQYHWQNYALSLKKKLFNFDESKLALSIVSTLEYWRSSSGSEESKSIYNETEDALGKDRFNNLIGSFSLPISKDINENFTIVLVPGVSFLPEKLGKRTLRNNSYGNNFYLGTGIVLNLYKGFDFLASYTNLFGPGNNYFDQNLNYSRKSIYSFGLGWDISPKIGLQGKITNSYGSTPSTGILTIPTDNKPLYSANIIYKLYEDDIFLKPLLKRDKLMSFGGTTVNNALIPSSKTSQVFINYDSKGNLFGFYGYSLSNIFQLELLNIGRFNQNLVKHKNVDLKNNYLSENNINYRIGGKLLIITPQKNDLFWMSLRTSLGRNDETNQGYLISELISTFRLNDLIALNLSPKYFFSGTKSFGGLGASTYINLSDSIQLIPEINSSFRDNPDFNSTITLRYAYLPNKSIDLYYSDAPGIQDIGQFLEDKKYRFGIKLNFLY